MNTLTYQIHPPGQRDCLNRSFDIRRIAAMVRGVMQTIVIGHRNPDMDSICSAIAYAHLKRETGDPGALAGRAGNTNERINFVLERFGFDAPAFFSDVSPQVGDVMQRDVFSATESTSVYDSLQIMETHGLRGLPITEENGRLLGLLSVLSVTRYLLPPIDQIHRAREVRTSLEVIVRCFGGQLLSSAGTSEVRNLQLVVGAMSGDSFRQRIRNYKDKHVVLLVGDRPNIQRTAIEEGVYALIATGGTEITAENLALANAAGVSIARSPLDTATTILLSRGAIDSKSMVTTRFPSFHPETPLEFGRQQAAEDGAFAFPVIDEDGKLVGILSKSDLLKPVPRQLVLVDHNELTQAVKGAEKVPIVEILDHHRVGGFSSSSPMHFWNNPVGSTCTIVALCYEQTGVPVPAGVAGLLMAGLISDTLNLTSPTATPVDRRILEKLGTIAGENPTCLAEAIFAVGSPLLTLGAQEVVNADAKTYEGNGYRFSIAQIEELGFANFHERSQSILQALEADRKAAGLFFSALLVTDINKQNSLLVVAGDGEFLPCIDYPSRGPNLWQLDGVVSRKKQLLPFLTGILDHLPPAS